MPKLSPIHPKKLEKILFQLWFVFLRSHWSHRFYAHTDGRTTVIPFHGSEDIGVWLVRKILRDIQISLEDFDSIR